MSKFDNSSRSGGPILTTLLCSLGLIGSCSEASDRLNAWPGSLEAQPGSTTGESNEKGEEDQDDDEEGRSKNAESFPDSSEGIPETTTSSSESETSSSFPDSESASGSTSESSDQTSSTNQGSDQGSSVPPKCVQVLCYETNSDQKASGEPRHAGQVIFRLFLEKGMKRLARIELVEGFSEEPTTVAFRKNGEKKHGDLLAELSWSNRPSDRLEWVGTDFDEPIHIEGERVIWVEVSPADREFYSLSDSGKRFPMWERWSPASEWTRDPAPLMFRAYCCEE